MQIVKTILWVLLFAGLLLFTYLNWYAVDVQLWENLVLETKLPAVVITSFLLGFVPMWLVARGQKWRYEKRIRTLETATANRYTSGSSTVATTATPAATAPVSPHAPGDTPLRPVDGPTR